MPARQDDDLAWRAAPGPDGSVTRSVPLAAAVALAVVATLVVFLTEDVKLLRLAAVGAAWAVVAAAFVAVRRRAEQRRLVERELELRRVHDRELDLEAAARRELELEIENDVRRETEEAMQGEFAALRADLAALTGLRDDLAGVARLRGDLRSDLGQLPELRADLARLRAELAEQLSGEMLVERIIMRTQGFRPAGNERSQPATGSLEAPSWREDPPPAELTGGWAAVRLDDAPATREYEPVRAERPAPGPARRTPLEWLAERSLLDLPEPTVEHRVERRVERPYPERPYAEQPPDEQPKPVPYRRRHDADPGPGDPDSAVTVERPGARPSRHDAPRHDAARHDDPRHDAPRQDVPRHEAPRHDAPGYDAPGYERPPLPPVRPVAGPARPAGAHEAPRPSPAAPETAGQTRLSEILAESGSTAPPSGGRRRRRYRDEDEPDDVLSRVLRGE